MNKIWIGAHANNFGVGRAGKTISKIVMHWIVGNLSSADATFNKSTRLASAHYGVEDATVHQYVNEKDTAWHASNLSINQESIGIEHSGGELLPGSTTERRKPSEATHETSAQLVAEIAKKYNIPLDRQHILLHREIKATTCPGTLDVDRIIERARVINTPEPATPPTGNIISLPGDRINFNAFQTELEKYDLLTLETLKAKLLAKDKRIKQLESAPAVTPVNEQTKYDFGEGYGVMELQAVKSVLKAQKDLLAANINRFKEGALSLRKLANQFEG